MLNPATFHLTRDHGGPVVAYSSFDWTFGLGKSKAKKTKEADKKENRLFNQGIKAANAEIDIATAQKKAEIVRQEKIKKASTIGLWVSGGMLAIGAGYLIYKSLHKPKRR